MAKKRRRNTRRGQDSGAENAAKAIGRYFLFTLVTDWQRDIPYVPRVVLNWAGIALVIGLWVWVPIWWIPAAATLILLAWTITRASRTLPRRSALIDEIYQSTMKDCGHPRATVTVPSDPRKRVKIRRWGRGVTVRKVIISYTGSSPAGQAVTRSDVEARFENAIPVLSGEELVFDWEAAAGKVVVTALPESSLEVQQKHEQRRYYATIRQSFRSPDKQLLVSVDEWGEWETPDGPAPRAQEITARIGTTDLSASGVKQRVEHTFDEQVQRDGVWVYDWTAEGILSIRMVDRDSTEAIKKAIEQKVNALASGLVRSTRTAMATAEIVDWVDQEGPALNTPVRILIDFSTIDVSSAEKQEEIEKRLDDAFRADWQDRVWLYDWEFGPSTILYAGAVPDSDPRAQRKIETKRLQSVAAQKFPTKKSVDPVRVEVLEWHQVERNGQPREKPKTVRIDLSTYDVTNQEVRFNVEQHFDVLYGELGWHYDWNDADGTVTLTEVPALPQYLLFPEVGTPEFDRLEQSAANGRIVLGPAKGGGEAFIDYNKVPHSMLGGNTGAGKSVALNHPLFWALWSPDEYELLVCDPKRTDFTWTPEFPNVRFAATIPEITDAVEYAHTEMNRRQDLLSRYGVRNIGQLVDLAKKGKAPWADVPKRLILFFDEMSSFLTGSKNDEVVVLQDEARTNLEQIMMLGRAPWVNIVGAAQKPSNENMGTAIRELMGNRIGIGWMKTNMSEQVLGSTICSRFSREKTPRGRGWVLSEGQPDRLVQTMYVPDRTEEVMWAEGEPTVTGLIDRIRERLTSLGYTPYTMTNKQGGEEQRWHRPEPTQDAHEDTGEHSPPSDEAANGSQPEPAEDKAEIINLFGDGQAPASEEQVVLPPPPPVAPTVGADTQGEEEFPTTPEEKVTRSAPESREDKPSDQAIDKEPAKKDSPIFDPLA